MEESCFHFMMYTRSFKNHVEDLSAINWNNFPFSIRLFQGVCRVPHSVQNGDRIFL